MQWYSSEYDYGRLRFWLVKCVGDATDREVLDYLAWYRQGLVALQNENQRFFGVFDFSDYNINAHQRSIHSEWLKSENPRLKALSLGLGFVVASRIMRGVITAIYWLAPPVVPYTVTGTTREALTWAYEQSALTFERLPFEAQLECTKTLLGSASEMPRAMGA